MAVFSHAQHNLGLAGAPRRTMLGAAPYLRPEWHWDLMWVGIGGTGLFMSALLYFLNIVGTLAWSRGPAPRDAALRRGDLGAGSCPRDPRSLAARGSPLPPC